MLMTPFVLNSLQTLQTSFNELKDDFVYLGVIESDVTTDKCSSEKVYQWLDENAYKYGFVKRYPEDKTDITGISNEPWHYRYVGTTVSETIIKSSRNGKIQ